MDLGDGRLPQAEMTPAARRHILTKGMLRTLVAYVNKGATVIHPYAARGSVYGLVDETFFAGGEAGGETIAALGRLTSVFAGALPLSQRRAPQQGAGARRRYGGSSAALRSGRGGVPPVPAH